MNKKQLWLYVELWLAMPHYKAETLVGPPSIGFQSVKASKSTGLKVGYKGV